MPTVDEFKLCLDKFLPVMDYSYNNGMQYITDDYLINNHGFQADLDENGNVFIRTATITQEYKQRAKVMTAPAEMKKRDDRAAAAERALIRRADETKHKVQMEINAEETVVKQLCHLAGKEPLEDNLVHCTLDHFDKVNADSLRKFVTNCHLTLKKPLLPSI